jgi:hypothetical protein
MSSQLKLIPSHPILSLMYFRRKDQRRLSLLDPFEGIHLAGQIGIGGKYLLEPDKGPHDFDLHLNGAFASKDTGETWPNPVPFTLVERMGFSLRPFCKDRTFIYIVPAVRGAKMEPQIFEFILMGSMGFTRGGNLTKK